jgi:hypothetical protein
MKSFSAGLCKMLLVVVAVICPWEHAAAQCYCEMENMSVSTNKSKPGYGELCSQISTPAKYYLTKIQTIKYYYHSGYCDGTPPNHDECKREETDKYNTVEIDTVNSLTGAPNSPSYSGNASLKETGGNCGSDEDYTATLNNDDSWSDEIGDELGAIVSSISPYLVNTKCSATQKTDEYHASDVIQTCDASTEDVVFTTKLSSEYTDGMLRGDMITLLPNYPAGWSGGTGRAFYSLSADHFTASGGKMKYRVKVPNSVKDQRYLIKWDEVTTYSDGTSSSEHKQETITGTGDPVTPAYGSTHEVQVPATPSSIYETAPVIDGSNDNSLPGS